jgi:hypothetical protein
VSMSSSVSLSARAAVLVKISLMVFSQVRGSGALITR